MMICSKPAAFRTKRRNSEFSKLNGILSASSSSPAARSGMMSSSFFSIAQGISGRYRPLQEGLFRHFLAMHNATDLPIFLYDVGARTGCKLEIDTICRLAELPRVLGLKDATGDFPRPAILGQKLGQQFRLLNVDDKTAMAFLANGGNGRVSVLSNVAPKMCQRLFLACTDHQMAEASLIERRLKPLVAAHSSPRQIPFRSNGPRL